MSTAIAQAAAALSQESARVDSGFCVTGSREAAVRVMLNSLYDLPRDMLNDRATPNLDQDIWHDLIDEMLK